MSITDLDHAALSVADLERSIRFYVETVGARLVRRLECGPDSQLGKVVGMPGASARIAHLRLGSRMIELFQYANPPGRPAPQGRDQADQGVVHVGFVSTDVRADYARMKALGAYFVSEPVEFRPDVWIVYFRGPDGETCELRQVPPGD